MGSGYQDGGGYRSSPLDVRRLSLFLAVVDHGGFSKAAHAVHISQPALSQAVAELEAELGGPLFHRLGRRVALTDAGSALMGPARSVLRAVDAARQVAAEVTGLERGRLDLSSLRTLAADPLPPLLGAFVRRHPKVEVHLASPDDPADLVEQIRSGQAELGVTAGGDVPAGMASSPLGEQVLWAVFPPGTERGDGPVAPGELVSVPLIATPPGTSGRDLLDGWLAGAGQTATLAVETSQREAVVPLVLAGAGAALVPAGAALLAAAGGAVCAAVEPSLVRALVVLRRVGTPTPAAAAFLDVVAAGVRSAPAAAAPAGTAAARAQT